MDVTKKNLTNLFKSSSTPSDNSPKYELKHKLYEMVFQSASYLTHDKDRALYDALQESMQMDELQARYESAQPSREHKLQIGSTVMFAKKMKSFPKKVKITRSDLEGLTFKLLKNRFKNSVELEFNLEQCYLTMTDKIEWTNPEGDRFHTNLSKQLPLEGPPGRKTIQQDTSSITT
ncbi:hypothetical protein Tco_1393932 [Tanacetum coccineum]